MYMMFRKINHKDTHIASLIGGLSDFMKNEFLSIDNLFLKLPVSDISVASVITQGVFKIYGDQTLHDIKRNKNRYTKMSFTVKYYNKLAMKKKLGEDGISETVIDEENSVIGVREFKNGLLKFLRNPVAITLGIASNGKAPIAGMHMFEGDITRVSFGESFTDNYVRVDVEMNIIYKEKLTYLEFAKELK